MLLQRLRSSDSLSTGGLSGDRSPPQNLHSMRVTLEGRRRSMKNFNQWIKDKLFDLLTWLTPNEQPNLEELRAHAREEVQKPPQPTKIWVDPTIRSYSQPQKQVQPLHVPPGSFARAWHDEQQFSGKLPRISQVLPRIRLKPVDQETKQPVIRTNTDPLGDDSWLNSVPKEPTFAQAQAMLKADIAEVPTARDIAPKFDPLNTDESPAVVKLLHQKRQQERHAS